MRKLFTNILLIVALVLSSCAYDDTAVWSKLDDHESRISTLEELCREMNTNISALQSLVDAMQGGDYITSIVPVTKDGYTIGYTITFAENDPITIFHGTNGKDGANGADGKDGQDGADGKDGYTPVIGVKQDSDGIYYWTLDGAWLLDDSGNKIKAVGTDGKDGQDGANGADGEDGKDGQDGANGADGTNGNDGANGTDGKDGVDGKDGADGITPQLKIEEGYWYVSYDNGASWTQLGKATGEDGQDGANGADGVNGDAFFANITIGEESVSFTLADGTEFVVPLVADSLLALLGDISYIPKYTDGKATVTRYADGIILAEFDFSVTPKSMATTIAENYETLLAINAIETVTRAVTLIRMPIVACEADEKSGTISIQASGEFLNPGAFTGDITYSAALTISDGVNSVISDYIELCTYDPTDDKIIYYTTSDAAPVKLGATIGFGGILLSNEYDVEANLGKMTFSAPVTRIPANTFISSTISTISIPATVSEIGESAFKYCLSLTSVTIPDSVTEIGEEAFYNCLSLTSVTIPDSVTSIGELAFFYCYSLTSFYGKFASEDNRCLIVDGKLIAFAPAGLIEYTIPDSVTKIGNSAFSGCDSLTSVTIPNSVNTIGDSAFRGCSSLTSVTIGNSVTEIGYRAFEDCTSLTSVYCKAATPPSLGGYAFKWYDDGSWNVVNIGCTIYVPAASVEAYKSAAGWSDYASDIVGYEF